MRSYEQQQHIVSVGVFLLDMEQHCSSMDEWINVRIYINVFFVDCSREIVLSPSYTLIIIPFPASYGTTSIDS